MDDRHPRRTGIGCGRGDPARLYPVHGPPGDPQAGDAPTPGSGLPFSTFMNDFDSADGSDMSSDTGEVATPVDEDSAVSDGRYSTPPSSVLGTIRARVTDLVKHPGIRKRVLGPFFFDGSILVTNMITGIIVARSLGPAGRGELAAILILMQTGSWIFSLGGIEAIAFHQARHPQHGARLMGSWLSLIVPLSILAIIAGELLLPTMFSAQTSEALHLAQLYMPLVFIPLTGIVFSGILLGDRNFVAFNTTRLITPALAAIGYVILWPLGLLTVEAALVVNAIALLAAAIYAGVVCFKRHSLGPPQRWLLRKTIAYGAQSHGGSLAGFINARLDILIIPAFLVAAEVGLYSVATNVASIVATLTGTIAIFALPVATAESRHSARVVIRTMHAVFLIGSAFAVTLIIIAPLALRIFYGPEFVDAAPTLRILLPGEVLSATATVLISGLLAANRPLLTTMITLPAAIVTVLGLLLFLGEGGIDTAALITTIAYSILFVLALIAFRRVAGLRWRDLIKAPPPGRSIPDGR
jgi:O-antigen/teichoic acid export membrane protein